MCQHIAGLAHTECPVYWNGGQEASKSSQIMISCYDRSGSAHVCGHACVLHVYVVVYRYACVCMWRTEGDV